jgi:four helix bundle protein
MEPELCGRTLDYSLRALNLCRALFRCKDETAWVIAKQYLKAGTSIGANVEEAQAAESKADFLHKYGIAQKETRESRYWLRLVIRGRLLPPRRVTPLLQETEELLKIITAILVKAKRNPGRGEHSDGPQP